MREDDVDKERPVQPGGGLARARERSRREIIIIHYLKYIRYKYKDKIGENYK